MTRLLQYIHRSLSLRLSLMVIFLIAILFMVALFVMFIFSRRAVREEGLHKGVLSLLCIEQNIGNTLREAETIAGRMVLDVEYRLLKPDTMNVLSRRMLESHPQFAGCAIAFKADYYPDRGTYFMAYSYRHSADSLVTVNDSIIQAETFGNSPYTEQKWFVIPFRTDMPYWSDPLHDADTKSGPVISYCLPIRDARSNVVGVLAVDLSLDQLSETINSIKPTRGSYSMLLGREGDFIIQPDSSEQFRQNILAETDSNRFDISVRKAAEAMMAGGSDYRPFRMNGKSYYIFFKPFQDMGWSVGVILPDDDVFGTYNRLLTDVIIISLAGFVALLVLCYLFTRRLLNPLRVLTRMVQRISEGHYDDPIPENHQIDEIGRLQTNFQQMQRSLSIYMNETDTLSVRLREQGLRLQAAYDSAQEADRVKTSFLYNLSDQMIDPVMSLGKEVSYLREHGGELEHNQSVSLVNQIQNNCSIITRLLSQLLENSGAGKKVGES